MIEQTLSIIKPDVTRRNLVGKIVSRFEEEGLAPVEMSMRRLTRPEAEEFYAVHRGRPFFAPLVEFMTSGPIVVMVLEGPDAVERSRRVMGSTDPAQAASGTIRRDFAVSLRENSVHGSDSVETARAEIRFFFPAQST